MRYSSFEYATFKAAFSTMVILRVAFLSVALSRATLLSIALPNAFLIFWLASIKKKKRNESKYTEIHS